MSPILTIHIAVASLTLVACAYAWHRPSSKLGQYILGLSILALISGAIVALSSPLTLATCAKLVLYLATITSTKYMITVRTKVLSTNSN